MMKRLLLMACAAITLAHTPADGCTSAIVTARASATGRPLLWKHRDTGADNNFVAHVAATDSTAAYTALYNAGDSTLAEVWMGMNDRGFAIMNTASYNLAPDTATIVDREGIVMSLALRRCTTVDDFDRMLDSLSTPLGVQANFGVIDAHGGAAYFETDDRRHVRFDVDDAAEGYLVRTNFSISGRPGEGYGYIRYNTARQLIDDNGAPSPELFTETLSRSFYHSLTGIDYLATGQRYVADSDFIPRDISTASIVIEGIDSPTDSCDMTMWTILGYPPCSPVYRVRLDEPVNPALGPDDRWRSSACEQAMDIYRHIHPYSGGSGPRYIDLWRLAPVIETMHRRSMAVYGKNR